MALLISENKDEVKAKGRSLNPPKGSLELGCYEHKASKKFLYYLAVANNAADADKLKALQCLINAAGVSDIVAALNSGLSLAAGTQGRESWSPTKPGSPKAERSIEA